MQTSITFVAIGAVVVLISACGIKSEPLPVRDTDTTERVVERPQEEE